MKSLLIILSLLSISKAQSDVRLVIIGTKVSDILNITKASQFCPANRSRFHNSHKKSILYIHGHKESFSSSIVQNLTKAYLSRGDHNIFIVEWSKFSKLNRSSAVKALPKLAETTANILNEMEDCGLNLSKIHIVGHDLGAQIAGMIGANFKDMKNFKICRITGLDPAGSLFIDEQGKIKNYSSSIPELDKNDAVVVDVIHTDSDGLGLNLHQKPQGHVDFWVNGGKVQEGCGDCPICSHSRAVSYFTESVTYKKVPPHPFVSNECPVGVTNYSKENCVGSLKVSMGYHLVTGGSVGSCIPINLESPNFWLETKSSSPFTN